MPERDNTHSFDRRLLLGAGALALIGASTSAPAQQRGTEPPAAGADAKKISQILADYIVGFDLKAVPPRVIDLARIGFIDTLGVMLAGSREEISHILCEMVQAEGAAPVATVAGQSFRTSPQLAALANGVAAHAMDYDFTYISGQGASPIIPAILPVAE